VYASDLDRFCVDATRDNARANDAIAHIVQAAGLSWTTQRFDLVVANLMSALLIALASQLAEATREGGTLVVSGISAPRADDVEAALQAAGFSTLHKREQDGDQRGDYTERWTAFVMKK
jgi:ribosomal protein L11 methyltransferase